MRLYDYLSDGFISEGDFNCAERILYGANFAYSMNLPEEAMKLAAGFGGGMGVGGVCGAISGAMMVLSYLYVHEYAHESTRIRELGSELMYRVGQALCSTNCYTLKGLYRTETEKCSHIIYATAKVLDDIVKRESEHISMCADK